MGKRWKLRTGAHRLKLRPLRRGLLGWVSLLGEMMRLVLLSEMVQNDANCAKCKSDAGAAKELLVPE